MSMLTAQCDELRVLASELRRIIGRDDVPRGEKMAIFLAAGAMEEAADTILELRWMAQERRSG